MKDALARFGGGKKRLADMKGDLGPEMMAENLGISEDQLDQMIKFEASIDMTRDALIKRLKTGTEEEKKQARLSLKKGGIQGKDDAELITATQEAGYDQIEDTLDESTKKSIEENTKIRDFAKEQTGLQTSIMDKLGALTDWFMNQFYNLMIDIWDGIMSIPGVGKSADVRNLEKKAMLSRDPELLKAVKGAAGDMQKFRADMVGAGGIGSGLGELVRLTKTGTDAEKEAARSKLSNVMIDAQVGMTSESGHGAGIARSSLKAAGGVDDAVIGNVESLMKEGKQFSQAMKEAGLSEDKMQEALQKSVWYLPPGALVEIQRSLKGVSGTAGGGGGAPTSPTAATTAGGGGGAPTSPTAATVVQPTGGGPPVAVAPASAAPTPAGAQPPVQPEVKEFQDGMTDQLGYLGGKNDDILRVLKRSVKLDKSFLNGEYGDQIEKSVLAAVRVALLEYSMYKDMSPGALGDAMKQPGFDPKTFGAGLLSQAIGSGNAAGGAIIGQNPDGTAKILRPPAGEMPAFVGAGETIGGKGGGGGGNVNVTVNGIGGADLANMVKVAATNAIYEYKRRENLH
jgi:hypothetical protein